jgi:hypothetical protein
MQAKEAAEGAAWCLSIVSTCSHFPLCMPMNCCCWFWCIHLINPLLLRTCFSTHCQVFARVCCYCVSSQSHSGISLGFGNGLIRYDFMGERQQSGTALPWDECEICTSCSSSLSSCLFCISHAYYFFSNTMFSLPPSLCCCSQWEMQHMHHMAMLQMNQLAESAAAAAALSSSSGIRYSQPQRLEPFHNHAAPSGAPLAPGSVSSRDELRSDSGTSALHGPSGAVQPVISVTSAAAAPTSAAAAAGGGVSASPASPPRAGWFSRLGIGVGSSIRRQQDIAMRGAGGNRV